MTWVLDGRAWRTPVRAADPGTLEMARTVLDLPAMVPVRGRPEVDEPAGVRAWLTDQPVADRETAWRRWVRAFDRTGLWPLVAFDVEARPFRSGELGSADEPADAAAVLAAGWLRTTRVRLDGTRLPSPPWPGLAPGRGAPDESGVVLPPQHFAIPLPGELLLVPARQPADTVARLGWYGAGNWSLTGAAVAGVLRSWEERFGAYLVAIGSATLDLVVTRPPVTAAQCDLLAYEHLAFCPDNFFPQTGFDDTPISHEQYAQYLRGSTTWRFWWH